MKEHIKILQMNMERELEGIKIESDPVQRLGLSIKLVGKTVGELKTYMRSYTFQNVSEEILYFKTLAPPFYSKYFYLLKIYNIELAKRSTGKECLCMLYEQELKEVNAFFSRHTDFCRYYYLGNSFQDEKLYTRSHGELWILDELSLTLDTNFSVSSYRVSWIIAYEQYRFFLEKELQKLKNPEFTGIENPLKRRYGFKGTGADATEIIYSFDRKQLVTLNGVPANIKDIKEMWEELFHMKLGNISEKQRLNQSRKKDKTPFLNSLIHALTGE